MVRSIKLDLSKKQKLDGGSSNKWRANKNVDDDYDLKKLLFMYSKSASNSTRVD